jgi:hypothetical protein
MKRAYAVWFYTDAEKERPSPEHLVISCGVNDDQYQGYYDTDLGATVTYESVTGGTRITLSAPSEGLEAEADYWLSPDNQHDGREAVEFGIKEVA